MNGSLVVPRRALRLGPLLAEGGEGRVYELADRADLVYKAYRVPQRHAGLGELVGWSSSLAERAPALAARIRASTSWPSAVVVEGPVATAGPDRATSDEWGKGDPRMVAGLLLPRAPRRYSVRHRDGRSHLASLSYLTADPDRRSAAYGVTLPPPMGPERLGLVYALARLLEVFESVSPNVSHGDLSAKNVLWSLARGPEVFVLDCDNGERYRQGEPLGPPDRRRAMTPNWDDPAIPSGANPGPQSDRYSLALIFLRVCGAAHYPIQKRQKTGEAISLEVGVPATARRVRSLSAAAPLWDLCARGLSAGEPASRPSAGAWVEALRAVIEDLGAARILDAVWAAQGRSPVPAAPVVVEAGPPVRPPGPVVAAGSVVARSGDVTVRPVPAAARSKPTRAHPPGPVRPGWNPAAGSAVPWVTTRNQAGGITAGGPPPGGFAVGVGRTAAVGSAGGGPGVAPAPVASGSSAWAQLRHMVKLVALWLLEEHRRTVRYLRTPDRRRRGVLRIVWCVAVDFVTACLVLFLVAMIASPFLGI
jgi:hypothetical protein